MAVETKVVLLEEVCLLSCDGEGQQCKIVVGGVDAMRDELA